ncbi:hypothetical protein ACFYW5_15445, partial [Streptomyces sp. NPDC002779]
MIKWAGWIITLCGAAHTLGALTVEKAAQHAGTWFSGGVPLCLWSRWMGADSGVWNDVPVHADDQVGE